MECKDVLQYIHQYLDGELEGEDLAGFLAHIEACETCNALLLSYQTDKQRLGQFSAAVPDMRLSIWRGIREARRARRTARKWWLSMGAAAAAVVVFCAVGPRLLGGAPADQMEYSLYASPGDTEEQIMMDTADDMVQSEITRATGQDDAIAEESYDSGSGSTGDQAAAPEADIIESADEALFPQEAGADTEQHKAPAFVAWQEDFWQNGLGNYIHPK